ncbi:MAG: preprotein translocase subunit YajC [Propionibacteriaceae bacterium]|nr:preprotein translocase subunit YajC [Propionibacteriaceae bacterium]
MFQLIAIFVIMGLIMYFFMIRPAKKQQAKQQEMMNALEIGSRVMLGSGIYGTIRHLGEKQAVIEVSPGVDLTIMRAAIRTVVSADDEEFEYSDEVNELENEPITYEVAEFDPTEVSDGSSTSVEVSDEPASKDADTEEKK